VIWGYDGAVPGPLLRLKRGEELRVRVVNDLPDPTVVHWHGVRLPNAMDGVPHMTQPPIEPGAHFDYRFHAPDAGTFWYHTHLYSSEQLERGLYGPLIVDESEPIEAGRDVVLMLDDWRLAEDAQVHEASFRSFHDASHAGRMGRHLTANSAPTFDIPVRTNERLRLRLINAANARIFTLRVARHRAIVIAMDGQPCEPYAPASGVVTLGPGNRVDLLVDATLEPGSTAPIVADTEMGDISVARLVYGPDAALAATPPALRPLPDNPLPAPDLANTFKVDAPLEGGMMSPLMMRMMRGPEIPGHGIDPRARVWTVAGFASSGHDGPPLFSVPRGRTVELTMSNDTAFPHAMHVHGHHFRVLTNPGSRNGGSSRGENGGVSPFWLDTALMLPRETWRIAFVADNPGKWMIHCHMLEHQETGMAAWFAVT
jgi:FtsP/CotA-like multicopper oxidase with cupredoxin domain